MKLTDEAGREYEFLPDIADEPRGVLRPVPQPDEADRIADEKLAAEWLCEGIYELMMGSSVNSTLAEAGLNALDPPKRIPRLTGRRWNELHSVIIDKVTNTLIGIAGVRSPYGIHHTIKLLSGDKTGPTHISSMPRKRIRPERKAKR